MAEQQQKTAANKTKDEIEAEQLAAKEQLNAILDSTRPKHLGYGLSSGVGNIVAGAVGAVGIAVLAPTLGFGMGAHQGGIGMYFILKIDMFFCVLQQFCNRN